MNWAKARGLLIRIFLIVNIVLLLYNYGRMYSTFTLTKQQQDNIRSILSNRGVTLYTNIPRSYFPIQKIKLSPYERSSQEKQSWIQHFFGTDQGVTVSLEASENEEQGSEREVYRKGGESVVFYDQKIIYENEYATETKEMIAQEEVQKLSKVFLEKVGYEPDNMVTILNKENDQGYTITYYEQHKNYPVFDSYVRMKLNAQGIYYAEIHKVKIEGGIGKKRPIYPPDEVLFQFMYEMIPKKMTETEDHEIVRITDIKVGYMLPNHSGKQLIEEEALPFYCIVLGGGQEYYVNAYTNQIEMRNEEKYSLHP